MPEKQTSEKDVQTEEHRIDVDKKNAINLRKSLEGQKSQEKSLTVQKSLELLEIPDENDGRDIEVSFEKKNVFTESQNDEYRTPNDFLEPLNEAMAEQIDQLIAKLNDCADGESGGK